MFLFPQHLQAFSRELQTRLQLAGAMGLVGDWGTLELELDKDALESDIFAFKKAVVLFRDGTLACFPGNATVDQREFTEFFKGPTLDVYLGVPAAQSGVPQVGDEEGRHYRYVVGRESITDENERDAKREMEFRSLHGRIFFGDEDRSGFDTVPVARLARVGEPQVRTVPSPHFIPPVLTCGASPTLFGALQNLSTKARAQSRDLAARMPDVAKLSSVDKGADVLGLIKLQAVNQVVAQLEQVAHQESMHPFHAYQSLIQAAGALAVFGPHRVLPEFPAYDHSDLDGCFGAALDAVDDLLEQEVAAPYDIADFSLEQPGLFTCAIPKEWVGRKAIFHLGIEMDGSPDIVKSAVEAGVKLCGSGDYERVIHGVMPGVALHYERVPPLSFPKRKTLHYFSIETEGTGRDMWLRILESACAKIISVVGDDGLAFQLYVEFPD